MKAVRILLALAVVAVAIGFAPTAAKAGAFTSYESGIQIQNLDNADADISLIFYNQDGTIFATVSGDTTKLAPYGQKTFFPLSAVLPTGSFNGSVVVTSTTNVASVSDIRGASGAAAGMYVASSTGNTTIGLPILMKGNGAQNNNTWFNVQNAGTGPANITVNYSDGTTASFANLAAGAAHTFDQTTETHSKTAFAGTVTTNGQPVVVTVVQETARRILASNGFTAGATLPVFPLINVQPGNGMATGLNIQNMGASQNTVVTVTYKGVTSGSVAVNCTETQTIEPGAVAVFALVNFGTGANPATITSNCDLKGKLFVGSASVTANSNSQPLAAIINQQKGIQFGSAYGSFDPSAATAKFVAPQIQDRNGQWKLWTSINLMNVGSVETTVTCTFTNSAVSWTSKSLKQGEGDVHLQNGALGNPYVGGATCTANAAGAQIIAVINKTGGNPNADQMTTYEAINVAP